jgi:hypothetical protein
LGVARRAQGSSRRRIGARPDLATARPSGNPGREAGRDQARVAASLSSAR